MSKLVGLRSHWAVLRNRHPRAMGRLESVLLAARGYPRLCGEVRVLRTRLGELERDHRLLAAHVSALTERLDAGSPPAASGVSALDREAAHLSAIAFYEHRIARLETHLSRRRTPFTYGGHARPGADAVTDGRTLGDLPGRRA